MALSDIEARLIGLGCIPWDKSWIIRMGYLDFFRRKAGIFEFLEREKNNLSSDLESLSRVLTAWKNGGQDIDVGESATLYRFFIYHSWVAEDRKIFIKRGSLLSRPITDEPRKVINQKTKELLLLDGGTSQWASAAYLYRWLIYRAGMRIKNPPVKLKVTYDAIDHWLTQRRAGQYWEPRHDETILRQAVAVIDMLKTSKTAWRPEHSEDYCLARALGLMSRKDGEKLFSSVASHETNRFGEMEKVIADVKAGREIVSIDHRPIQAGVALQLIQKREIKIKHPEAVGKSWPLPQFLKFVDFCQRADL